MTLSGTGIAGATISIYEGTTVIGTALVGTSGTWSHVVTLSLGTLTLSAKQTHAISGATSVASSSIVVKVYAPPPLPAIVSYSTPAPTRSSSIVTLTGTGVAGHTITIYDGTGSIATVVVGALGSWSKSMSLSHGTHYLSATQAIVTGVNSATPRVTVVVPYRT